MPALKCMWCKSSATTAIRTLELPFATSRVLGEEFLRKGIMLVKAALSPLDNLQVGVECARGLNGLKNRDYIASSRSDRL